MDPQGPTAFEFGGFRLDGRRRLLLDADGNVVPLTGKTFDALVFFVEHAGEAVERAALLEALWPGVIVEENSLSQVVLLLRRALGDGFIVTIKGRGYQFVKDVQVVSVDEADARPNGMATEPRPDRRRSGWLFVATLGVAVVAAIGWIAAGPYSSGDMPDQHSVAVLPFENLSASEADAVFVDGMHNDIVTQLAKIRALKVTSRASVLEYRGRARNLCEIGEMLGVATVLEGTVQRAVDAVRVNVQLIDTRTDEHIWAETYDFEPTAGNLFTIQSRIATSVADALKVAILPSEATRLGAVPTESSRAYDFFLSAREYDRRGSLLAERQYVRAVEEDPGFALAWAYLSWWHMEAHWFRIDGSDARKQMALEAAERALALEPDLPEAHIALGWYYFKAEQRYEAALEELAIAEHGMPGDIAVPWSRGNVLRWAGRWDEALAELDRAARLDPRNTVLLLEPAEVHIALRNYAEAERQLDRILEMLPDHVPSLVWKTMIPLLRDGDVGAARGAVDDPTYPNAGNPWYVPPEYLGWTAALYERDYDAAIARLDAWAADEWADVGYFPKESLHGTAHSLAGRQDAARRHFEAARAHVEALLADDPKSPILLIALGETLAGLGEHDAAIRAAHEAILLAPTERDAVFGPILRLDAVLRVFAPAGEADSSIAALDAYLSAPGMWSLEGLLPDPRLDSIRNDTRFAALVEKHRRR